ncbi:MAG: orotate phosphoribosyltransferase [Crenarchaeota archaeon]|nr:orotate phosphoribosyltransferase [Thermoproteota archaeon]
MIDKICYRRLQKLLIQNAIRIGSKPFILNCGLKTYVYIDAKTVTLDPQGSYLVGKVMFDIIKTMNVNAVGGRTLGADPISASIMYTAYTYGYHIKQFIVRKTPKAHGTSKWIEGNIERGDRVLVVDDVLTTGWSLIRAIQHCREHGLEVEGALVLVDRQELGGKGNVERALKDKPVIALFNKTGDRLLEVDE